MCRYHILTCLVLRRHCYHSKSVLSQCRFLSTNLKFPTFQRFIPFQNEGDPNNDIAPKRKQRFPKSAESQPISLLVKKYVKYKSLGTDSSSPESLQGRELISDLEETTATQSLRGRLHDVTEAAKNTVVSIESVNKQEATETAPTLDIEDNLEKAVELIAFEEDFQGPQKTSPLHGTEDTSTETSSIPCSGCGALLQCHSRIMPGFMVSEIFNILSEVELKSSICQRCYYMRHCNAFIEVKSNPEEYAKMISKIRPTQSVVVMVVDMIDVEGSIVPQLRGYIGRKTIVVVGNKADLLAPDNPNYLETAMEHLKTACSDAGLNNVNKFILTSAKTGYGIEKLISHLFSFNKRRVDMYIVGTANSGKSSLFNMLLGSDFCLSSARNLIQRATVSQWPGTTLSLLKFPITRVGIEKAYNRHKRLKQERALRLQTEKIQRERKKEFKTSEEETWELKGTVKESDFRSFKKKVVDDKGAAWGQQMASYRGLNDGKIRTLSGTRARLHMLEFKQEEYDDSYWMYDTPGIINPNQIMNLLTQDECTLLTPTSMIIPRCLSLWPEHTLFISGLARIDYLKGPSNNPLMVAVHTSHSLPLRVGPTEAADEYYEEHNGTEKLAVPFGDKERLAKLPALEGREFVMSGFSHQEAFADIQLSSLGFVSFAGFKEKEITVRALTPGGKGLLMRQPSLAPKMAVFRGGKIFGTPFFKTQPAGSAMVGKSLEDDWLPKEFSIKYSLIK